MQPRPVQELAQPGHLPAGGERLLDRVHRAPVARGAEGDVVALGVRRVGQHVQRLVDGGAPGVDAVRGGRDHEGPVVRRVLLEPVRGLRPVVRDLLERTRLQDRPVDVRPGKTRQHEHGGDHRGQPARPHRHPLLLPALPEPQREHGGDVGQAERQGEGQPRLELVDVAERHQPGVQPLLHGPVEETAQRTAVPGERDERDREHGQHQPAALGQIAPGQTGQTQRGGQRRAQDRDGPGDDGPPGGQPGLTEVQIADPVARAAQHLGRRHGRRRGERRLHVRHEVLTEDAQQQQRNDPPRGREDHAGYPPQQQRPLARTSRPGEHIEPHRQQ